MPTLTVDLPAHNVWPISSGDGGGLPPSVRVGGTDCLVDPSDGQYVEMYGTTTGFLVGATESIFEPGYGVDGGSQLGFGLFDLPAGAELLDCRFVSSLEFSGSDPIPDGTFTSTDIAPIPVESPVIAIDYSGQPLAYGYALSPSEAIGDPIVHLLPAVVGGSADYVIAGIGTPDTGVNGLGPSVHVLNPFWPVSGDYLVRVHYLAIRVTYQVAGLAPRRLYPRDDALGVGIGHLYPRPSSRQAGRLTGYL